MDTPDFSLPPKASPGVLPEVAAFLDPFAPVFHYRPSRESAERYLSGLLTDLPRKNAQTIAAAVAGTSTERLQHLLTDAPWDPRALDEARVRWLAARSPAAGVLVVDDSGLVKQGRASVGVARQYSGTLGKVGNCQVVVSAEYVADDPTSARPLHWPVSAHLFLPAAWAGDPARRARAHIPAAETGATKLERALGLVDRARAWGVPFAVVVADAGYGDQPAFLDGLEARGLAYVCAVESTFGVRRPAEVARAAAAAATPPSPRRGRGRPKQPRPAPLYTAAAVLAALPEDAWQAVTWREGARGPLTKQFVALRVHRATGGAHLPVTDARVTTGPEGWLLGERPLPGHAGEAKYYFCLLPADTPLQRLVELAHARWAVEQFYEDAKGECGLDDYQGRRWDGLHRHLALVMLAYSFLMAQSLPPPDPAASPTAGFPPLRPGAEPARRPSSGADLALPGPRPLAGRDASDRDLPPPEELTK
jgi:SRSO17 transposase